MQGFKPFARLDELAEGRPLARDEVVVVKLGTEYFAYENACPHQAQPFGDTPVSCDTKTVTCPLHDWVFRLSDGECVRGGVATMDTYPTRVEGDTLWVGTVDG